jgi:hypothetical protein
VVGYYPQGGELFTADQTSMRDGVGRCMGGAHSDPAGMLAGKASDAVDAGGREGSGDGHLRSDKGEVFSPMV